MLDAAGTNILDLFEIGKGKANRVTEIIIVESCLSLLKPGGRMGIVLPDGNLNNPSLLWLRRWCEGKARILAVVSLPEETFRSADATVKASLVFFRRFTASLEETMQQSHRVAAVVGIPKPRDRRAPDCVRPPARHLPRCRYGSGGPDRKACAPRLR